MAKQPTAQPFVSFAAYWKHEHPLADPSSDLGLAVEEIARKAWESGAQSHVHKEVSASKLTDVGAQMVQVLSRLYRDRKPSREDIGQNLYVENIRSSLDTTTASAEELISSAVAEELLIPRIGLSEPEGSQVVNLRLSDYEAMPQDELEALWQSRVEMTSMGGELPQLKDARRVPIYEATEKLLYFYLNR